MVLNWSMFYCCEKRSTQLKADLFNPTFSNYIYYLNPTHDGTNYLTIYNPVCPIHGEAIQTDEIFE